MAGTYYKNEKRKTGWKSIRRKRREKRKRGRSRKTWVLEMRKTYEVRGEKWEDARKKCKDREKWKQLLIKERQKVSIKSRICQHHYKFSTGTFS